MAETFKQLEHIARIADDHVLMVGHIFIHHPQMEKIKNIDIGEILHISSERSNWGIYQTKTDPLLSLAVHDISIVQELIGTIKPSVARQFNFTSQTNPDRVWFSGERFDIDVSWYSPTRIRRTTILGTKGQIVWDQDQNTVTHYLNRITDNRAIAISPNVFIYDYDKSPLEYELEHFINCVKKITKTDHYSWNNCTYKKITNCNCLLRKDTHIVLGSLIGIRHNITQENQSNGWRYDLA